MKRCLAYLHDIPVDLGNNSKLITILEDWLNKPAKSYQIITLNAIMSVAALHNFWLKEIIKKADLVTIDGYGVLLALRQKGYHHLERLTGVDLTRRLLEICSKKRYSVYFYGGPPAVVKRMNEIIPVKWPGVLVAGIRDGYESTLTRREIINEIRTTQPRLLLAGLGTPAQEIFLSEVLPLLSGTIGIGVGGTFEVLSGLKRETPKLISKLGFEWFHRMLQEPRKLRLLPDIIRFWYLFLKN